MMINTEFVQIEAIHLINDGSGLAFSIVGGKKHGIMVKTIVPNGVADKNGRLKTGDFLLQIGEIVVNGLSCEQVAAVLRTCGVHVQLIVARPYQKSHELQTTQNQQNIIIAKKLLDDPVSLEKYLKRNSINSNCDDEIGAKNDCVSDSQIENFFIDVLKDDRNSLGITVAGYYCEHENISGIFIKDIKHDGIIYQRYRDKIRINDRICQINGQSLDGLSNKEAIELLKKGGPHLKLCLERLKSGPKYDKLIETIKCLDQNQMIESNNLELLLKDKWAQILHLDLNWFEILIIRVEIRAGYGLGLNLIECKDIRTCTHHFVRFILEKSPLSLEGSLQVHDEILEANGIQLLGLRHLEVVNILKHLPASVCLVCIRHSNQSFFKLFAKLSPITRSASNHSLSTIESCKENSDSSSKSSIAWNSSIELVHFVKDNDEDLGLSIIDYHISKSTKNRLFLIKAIRKNSKAYFSQKFRIGDQLVAVNSTPFENKTIDVVRNILQCLPNGPVEFQVAKLIHCNENIELNNSISLPSSPSSFDECLDEYKESLDTLDVDNFDFLDNKSILGGCASSSILCGAVSATLTDFTSSVPSEVSSSTFSVADEPKLIFEFFDHKNLSESNLYDKLNLNTSCSYNFIDEDLSPNRRKFDWFGQITKSSSYFCTLRLVASEPNLRIIHPRRIVVRKKKYIREYYNDFADCVPTKSASLQNLDSKSIVDYYSDTNFKSVATSTSATMTILQSSSNHSDANSYSNSDNSSMDFINKYWKVEEHVVIERSPDQTLGISIVGGKVNIEMDDVQKSNSVSGIFIKTVIEKSPAAKTNKFKSGDRILEVNGVDLRNVTHEDAVSIISKAVSPVDFLIQSWNDKYLSDKIDDHALADSKQVTSSNEHIKSGMNLSKVQKLLSISRSISISENTENKNTSNQISSLHLMEDVQTPSTTAIFDTLDKNINDCQTKDESVTYLLTNATSENISEIATEEDVNLNQTDDENDDDDEDYDEFEDNVTSLEGRTVSKQGYEIDRASAGNVKRTNDEIKADSEEEDYFGYTKNKIQKKYSWLGHTVMLVTLERGNEGASLGLSLAGHRDRNCMAVFVCGLNPNGIASKSGEIQVGDEILEVNGIVLHGRCHLNASAIIKSLSGPVFKIIVLRRKAAIDDLAVKPITRFPVEIEEEDEEEKYKNFPNVRSITFRKGPTGLGIMIIEGRHADVGQGIFISDIQEGSIAEKIGLEIGEMILSVNKETMVGINYDTAAQTLKRTDGVIQLVLSNPKKKPDESHLTNANNISLPRTPDHVSATETPVKSVKPIDPADCEIVPGTKTTIEINSDNKSLGFHFIGGPNTELAKAIVVNDIYKDGAMDKDGRLRIGDEILEINNEIVEKVDSLSTMVSFAKQKVPKCKIVVFRPDRIEKTTISAELVHKSTKPFGVVLREKQSNSGVYISEIIKGGCVDTETSLMIGDQLSTVNGKNVSDISDNKACALLKSTSGKVSLQFSRFKLQHR